MDTIYNIISSHPETAVDVLSWATMTAGVILGLCSGCALFTAFYLIDTFVTYFRNRNEKKSGKLTDSERLDLLESKIDSIADIVISSSPEEK